MPPSTPAVKILGIDPGTRIVGYGLIRAKTPGSFHPKHFQVLDVGVIRPQQSLAMSQKMALLAEAAEQLAQELCPDICAIETAFFGINPQSALKLGQARGALVASLAKHNIPIVELAPARVKRLIAGDGAASKAAMAMAIEQLLGFRRGRAPYDVTDALSIALACAADHSWRQPPAPLRAPSVKLSLNTPAL